MPKEKEIFYLSDILSEEDTGAASDEEMQNYLETLREILSESFQEAAEFVYSLKIAQSVQESAKVAPQPLPG
ncbi:MAG TPA: hypothetical protein DEA55_10130 [Rhodospirillaceae bacterium]|nr:hypothetical protein [Rhodospirillaceae bacterium]